MSAGARPQAGTGNVNVESADEVVQPWQTDGQDYGSDLGTGAPDPDGVREHNSETPRDSEDESGAATPPAGDADEAVAGESVKTVVTGPAKSAEPPKPGVSSPPGGQTPSKPEGQQPPAEGGNT